MKRTFSLGNVKGQKGDPGTNGQDGYSPSVSVTEITGGHRIVITDTDGAHAFDVMDGNIGSHGDLSGRDEANQHPMSAITDLVATLAGKASASDIPTKISDLTDDSGHYTKPAAGIPSTDMTAAVQASLVKADNALQAETDPVFSASPVADITAEDVLSWDGKSVVSVSSTGTSTDEVGYITIDGVEKKIAGGGGGGEPSAYIKSAAVSQDGNILTLTKKDNSTVQFAPSGSGGTSDHRQLIGRDAADQHPMSAITGLTDALAGKADAEDIPAKVSDLTNDSNFSTESWVEGITGNLTNLSTTAKTNLVAAINEVLASSDLYECTYGTTTFAEITAALNAGLLPVCRYSSRLYVYTGLSSSYHCFAALVGSYYYRIYVKDTWGSERIDFRDFLTSESDPIFAASPAAGISSSNISSWNGKYSKPSGGIPDTDLSSAVQTSLGKADTALQSHQDISGKVDKNNAITGATKCKITYDAKGLVTGGSDLAASDIPSLDTSKITSGTFADERIASASTWNGKSVVSVSASGTATDEVGYITVNGVEKKLAGGGGLSGTIFNNIAIPSDPSSWTPYQSGDYQYVTLSISGLKASYPVAPVVDCVLSGTDADGDNAILSAFGGISILNTTSNGLDVIAVTPPDVNVPIVINVWE